MAAQYWLVKSEPESFSIADLERSPGRGTRITGMDRRHDRRPVDRLERNLCELHDSTITRRVGAGSRFASLSRAR